MALQNEEILEEIEALKAIMLDEVIVHNNNNGYPNAVELTVKPATAQNLDEQHVQVNFIVKLPHKYPNEPPITSFRNPRGIDDMVLENVTKEIKRKCQEYLGLPVIYELIELVRENLTANNAPSCPCAICLFHFTHRDHFTKTPCFHYFHSNCMGRYVLNCEETAAFESETNHQPAWVVKEKRRLLCPVCRETITLPISGLSLLDKPPPEESTLLADFDPSSSQLKMLQEMMRSLFMHQQANGGIIDLDYERNKFLISSINDSEERQSPNGDTENENTAREAPQNSTQNVSQQRRQSGQPRAGTSGSHNRRNRNHVQHKPSNPSSNKSGRGKSKRGGANCASEGDGSCEGTSQASTNAENESNECGASGECAKPQPVCEKELKESKESVSRRLPGNKRHFYKRRARGGSVLSNPASSHGDSGGHDPS